MNVNKGVLLGATNTFRLYNFSIGDIIAQSTKNRTVLKVNSRVPSKRS